MCGGFLTAGTSSSSQSPPDNEFETVSGWATAWLVGGWKRHDSTPLDMRTDGYATGLVMYVLQQAGQSPADPMVARGLTWLVRHQDRATGMWTATSVNKERDPASDIGKFMSDAATAYAVLAPTRP